MLDSNGFDLWSNNYDKQVSLSDETNEYFFAGYKEVLEVVYNTIRENYYNEILDLGFGTAILAKKLYDDGCKITGIDFSVKMHEIAREKMKGAYLMIHDFSNGLPAELARYSYDVAVCTYAIHHLTTEQKSSLIDDVMKHLKRDGLFIIGDVMFENVNAMEQARERNRNEWDDEENYIIVNDIKNEVNEKIIEFKRITYCSGLLILRNSQSLSY